MDTKLSYAGSKSELQNRMFLLRTNLIYLNKTRTEFTFSLAKALIIFKK